MKTIKLREIAEIVNGELFADDPEIRVKGFSIDSRTIKTGEVFIAVKGNRFDGHDYIMEAIKNGAVAVIRKRNIDKVADHSVREILVNETLDALGKIAAGFRGRVFIPVVCVSGTNGKTTVKDMLAHILSGKYKVLKNKDSYNNIIGLSLTLFDLDSSHEVVVLELGTNYPGEIAKLAEIARPYLAVITNVGDGHLENLKNREGVFLEKISLLNSLPDDGMMFLNKDDSLLVKVASWGKRKRFFGRTEGSDFCISKINREENGYSFCLNKKKYYIPVLGEHNIYNAAAAIAVSEYLGMEYVEIRERLKNVALPKMRLEQIKIGDVLFINDAYNSNPSSFRCALKVLKENSSRKKKVVVAGDMLELGEKSGELHENIGKNIAEAKIDCFIALGDSARFIAESAVSFGMKENTVFNVFDHDAAAKVLLGMSDSDTIVLLKGSRASKMEEILKCFTTCYIH